MPFQYNPYVTQRPLPPQSNPIGPADLNQYLDKWYAGGHTDPTGFHSQQSQAGGADFGDIAGATATGLGLLGNSFGMANQSSGVEQNAPDQQFSATGEPVYGTGQFYNQSRSARPQGATVGETLSSAGQGALAGAQFGLPGAIIGGAYGLVTSLIGGGFRHKKQREEIRRARRSAQLSQQNYNTASDAFDQKQASQFDYMKRMDNTNRLYSLYS